MNSSCRKCEKYQISLIQLNYFKNDEAFFFPMFNTKQYPWMKVIHRWRHNRNLKTLITHEIMEILTYFFLQIFIIFEDLSDSSKKSTTFFAWQLPFKVSQIGFKLFLSIRAENEHLNPLRYNRIWRHLVNFQSKQCFAWPIEVITMEQFIHWNI